MNDSTYLYTKVCDFLSIDHYIPYNINEKINTSSVPRIYIIAKMAKYLAILLRKIGLTNFLGRLKFNPLVLFLLYRKTSTKLDKKLFDYNTIKQYNEQLDCLTKFNLSFKKWKY